jgi:hypothetical protein
MLKVMHGRPWANPDRTGGPIDDVFDQLREHLPGLIIERLEVTHPADDDNVYFIGNDNQFDRVQVDTAPGGQPPFLIENGEQHETTDTTEAVTLIRARLEEN